MLINNSENNKNVLNNILLRYDYAELNFFRLLMLTILKDFKTWHQDEKIFKNWWREGF
jgi:hypothetical protein